MAKRYQTRQRPGRQWGNSASSNVACAFGRHPNQHKASSMKK